MSEKIFKSINDLEMGLIEPMKPMEVYEIVGIDRKSFTAKVKTSKGVEEKSIVDWIKECLDKPEWKEFPKLEDFAGKCPELPDEIKKKEATKAKLTPKEANTKKDIIFLRKAYNGVSQEYAEKLKKNKENYETDLYNRNKNLNLLFVNFVDGFLKDGRDGNSPDDWVYVSKLFYVDNFNNPLKLRDDNGNNINNLGYLKSLLQRDKECNTLMEDSQSGRIARGKRSFGISSPVLDEEGFHNNVFKEVVVKGKDRVVEDMKDEKIPDEFKGIDGVKFDPSDGKFIIDALKVASGFSKDDLESCGCGYKGNGLSDVKGLLSYLYDMSKKGKKIKNYNAAVILVFFAIIVCSKAEEIINGTFEKQKKIYEEVYKSIEDGNPNFSEYEDLRFETDVEEKKKIGTFDCRIGFVMC